MVFWHDFLPILSGNEIVTYLDRRYLAYIALLAGWLILCYWIYARGIAPRFQHAREKSWPAYSKDIPFPLAFTWASDIPLAGLGFGDFKAQFERIDSTGDVVIVRGYYFRDEADSLDFLIDLGHRRIENALKFIKLRNERLLTEVLPQQVNADVRSNPFEAVRFEIIPLSDILTISGDTLELCFPIRDSLNLPAVSYNRLEEWIRTKENKKEKMAYIVGTADGTGVAESTDIALERAMVIKEKLIQSGWKEEEIQLSAGQRNNPLALHNRCVILYFE